MRQFDGTSHFDVEVTQIHAWSIPCCVVVSSFISGEGPLSAVVALFWELEDDGIDDRSEECGYTIEHNETI